MRQLEGTWVQRPLRIVEARLSLSGACFCCENIIGIKAYFALLYLFDCHL